MALFHQLWRVEIETPNDKAVRIEAKEHMTGETKTFIVQRDEVFELLVKWGLL